MRSGRLLPLIFSFILTGACAPVGSISGSENRSNFDEKATPKSEDLLEGIDLTLPTEEEETESMINSRLEHLRQEELLAQGIISYGQCRSGVKVPDPVTNKVIALTFDDGPNPATTPRILDTLRARGIKATFFLLGSKAKANPSLVQRIKAEGHVIASHSQTHKNFAAINSAQTTYEIKTPDALLSGHMLRGKFFRFPYGQSSCEGNEVLDSLRYQPAVGWHIDSCDWAMSDGYFTANEARVCNGRAGSVNFLSHAMKMINRSGGGIALFHDIHEATARNLDQVIIQLQAANYKFVTITNVQYFPKLNRGLRQQHQVVAPPSPQRQTPQQTHPQERPSHAPQRAPETRPSRNGQIPSGHGEQFFDVDSGPRPTRTRSQEIDPFY